MFYQKNIQMGFYDGYVAKHTRKNTFFKQIDMLIDWNDVEKEIKKVYKRRHSVDGRPAYSGLLLSKILLLGIWYGLSDEKRAIMCSIQFGTHCVPNWELCIKLSHST
jgi:IS5 family transposase